MAPEMPHERIHKVDVVPIFVYPYKYDKNDKASSKS